MLNRQGGVDCPDAVLTSQAGGYRLLLQDGDTSHLLADFRDQGYHSVRHVERWLIAAHRIFASQQVDLIGSSTVSKADASWHTSPRCLEVLSVRGP